MKILFLTLLDFDTLEEQGIYTDLMREFSQNNHEVYIISPIEKKKKVTTHLIENGSARILKVNVGNIQKTGPIEKGISLLTLNYKIKNAIKKYFHSVKFDLILYATPPITLANTINFVAKRDKAKTYLLLKDIFPQNAVDLRMISPNGFGSILYHYFRFKEKQLYKISDHIGCMSPANVKYVLNNNKEINPNKVEICPNTISPLDFNLSDSEKQRMKKKYEVPIDKTIFIYGGNLGKPQGVDYIINCVIKNESNSDSFILIVGSGTEYEKIRKIFEEKLFKNAKLINGLPKHEYEALANSCDVGLVFLDHRFTIPNFPSRILSYMQAEMPVLVATDKSTDLSEIVTKGEFGFFCSSEDVKSFNNTLKKFSDKNTREKMGKNAKAFLKDNYSTEKSYSIIMKHFDGK